MYSLLVTLIWIFMFGAVRGQVINSTTSQEEVHCPGKPIILTCETRGLTLRWRSNQYIGTGAQLIFSASDVDPPPQSSEENPNTTATLISNTNENGEGVHILVSNLQIITSAEFQVANITCVDDDDTDSDGRGTFTLRTLGDPEMPQDITATQRSFGNTGGCITAVTWNSPTNLAEDDVQYQVLRNGTDIPEYKGNETLAVYRVCTCSGSHILSVTATNRCGRKVQSSPSVAVTLDQNVTLLRECNAPTSPPTCPQVNSDDKCNDTAAIVLGVVLALVIAVIFILFFGLVCVIILCCYLRRNKDKEVGKG